MIMHKNNKENRRWIISTPLAFALNILLLYVIYAICRVEYVMENWKLFSQGLLDNSWKELIEGSLLFDTSAIVYTNLPYALLMLIPLSLKEKKRWQKVARWVFIIVNSLCIIINIADSVYFQYTGRRTTATVFSEFGNENNLGGIFLKEFAAHWYLVLLGIALILALVFLYQSPKGTFRLEGKKAKSKYYVVHVVLFLFYIFLAICGMRGGVSSAVRPIALSNANQYVNKPLEAAVIQNTPFALIRTYNKKAFVNPNYFTKEELDRLYSPVHQNADSLTVRKKNIVVLIVESFGREYMGCYNEKLEGGNYKGFTPFADKLYEQSLSFDYTFSNGRKSIDGMPSILSSIPMFIEPFFVTDAAMNTTSGLAGELAKKGYYTAFFHGADNGSMGFQAYARTSGFKDYFGRTEYNQDERFNGNDDFDGTWAVWDEPFLQYYAMKMSEMKEPFMTAVFTASSHHPFAVPNPPSPEKSGFKNGWPWLDKKLVDDKNPIHKCIRYTDYALQRFFEYAEKQPWYKNTLFVFTSDHTNYSDHDEYMTDLGIFGSPILFFDPSGELQRGRSHAIAEQIDIMPTVLGYLGYDNPFVAFGLDLFNTPEAETRAVNYNQGIYQYVKGDYVLQFDGLNVKAVYNFKNDWLMKHNLKGKVKEEKEMTIELKAIIQSYIERMIEDRLVVRTTD